jgi:putative sugar O-methyltransferase
MSDFTASPISGGSGQEASDLNTLRTLEVDYQGANALYHPSTFWESLRQKNIRWLEEYGLDNFKRTVNNNYFNWLVSFKSTYFYRMLFAYVKRNRSSIPKLFRLFTVSTKNDGFHTTYVSEETELSWISRKLYAIYLLCLYDYVVSVDSRGWFSDIEEPALGSPVTLAVDGKVISQDICNSYLEFSYIMDVLQDRKLNTIVEIGGGYGRLFYILSLLRSHKNIRLIMVDIPPALFLSQWYLGEMFPELKMFRYKDFSSYADVKEEIESSNMAFLLPHQLELLPDRSVDLLVNISSFQEMSFDQIKKYYEMIDAKARYFYTKQWLHWRNPDDGISVPAVIYPTRPEWKVLKAGLNPVHREFFEVMFEIPDV